MTTLDVTNLRTKQQQTDLGLHSFQPVTLLSALVTGSPTRGSRSISYNTGSSPSFSTIGVGQTIIFDTPYGLQKTFVRSISGSASSGTLSLYENSCVLTNGDVITILHDYSPFPVPPAIRTGIFYKFYDTAYAGQNLTPNPVVIMGSHRVGKINTPSHSVTVKVTASADDGFTNSIAGGTFNSTASDIFFGKSGSLTFNSFFRFLNVPIPQGANIASATLSVTAYSTVAGTLTSTISGNDEDNATAPTTYAGYNAKVLTSATVAWNTSATWMAESIYTSPSIITIIQEIVDRAGWVDGNALMLFVKDNAGTDYREVYSFDGSSLKVATLTITYTTDCVFNLDASQSYAIASGATISSYLWTCIHNGGGTSGITIASATSATTTLTITQADEYWLSCLITDSNGRQSISYRVIFTTPAYTDFTWQSFSGDWNSGGYRVTLNVTGAMTLDDFPDWTLIVISQTNYFNGVEGYVNIWGISNEILLCGYLRQGTSADNWGDAGSGGGTANTSFNVTTIDDLLNVISPLGSVSLGAVTTTPATWYEYASWMTTGRSIAHLIFWHSRNIFQVCDIFGLTANLLGVLQTDYTEANIGQQINSFAYNRGIFAKLMADNLGRLHLIQDAQMLGQTARDALDTTFTITKDDVSGMVTVVDNTEGQTSFVQLDGFAFDGVTSTPYISIAPGYRETDISFIMPAPRGGQQEAVSNQVLANQADGNERVGRYLADKNNNPAEIRFASPRNYSGAFTIIPVSMYEWGIANADLRREMALFGRRLICRHIDIQQITNGDGTYSGILQTNVVLVPEAVGPDGIQGNYPTGYLDPNPPEPDWDPPEPPAILYNSIFAYRDHADSGKGKAFVAVAGSVTLGALATFNSGSTDNISVCGLSPTLAIVCYRDVGNSNQGTACCLSVSGTTITPGAEAVFDTGNTTEIDVAMLSATKAIVCYRDGNNSNRGTACILDVSGTTITPATPAVFETNATEDCAVVGLTATKAIVAYKDSVITDGEACVLDVSGSTITPGTPIQFRTSPIGRMSIDKISSDSALVVFDGESADQIFGNILYNITTTFSVSAVQSIDAGHGAFDTQAATKWVRVTSPTQAIVVYQGASGVFRVFAVAMVLGATTIAPGAAVEIGSYIGSYDSTPTIAQVNANKGIVFYSDETTTAGRVLTIDFLAGVITENGDEAALTGYPLSISSAVLA